MTEQATRRRRPKLSGPAKTLLVLVALTGVLLAIDRISTAREIALATGPKSEAQRKYFVEAADRPGIDLFYKGLNPRQKLAMAKRLGEYSDEKAIALTGKLLGTFDAPAYDALTQALTKQAKANPEGAIKLIGEGATRPKAAIRAALIGAAPASLKPLAEAMKDPALRGPAKRLLLEAGPQAEPVVRPLVGSSDQETRTDAAFLLGEYRKTESIEALQAAYRTRKPPERSRYLASLVAIGATQNRAFFEGVFTAKGSSGEERALGAKGLSKIGTLEAVAPLARALLKSQGPERETIIAALAEAGDKTLGLTTLRPHDRFLLACRLRGAKADSVISQAIASQRIDVFPVLDALYGRPALTPALRGLALRIDAKTEAYKITQVLRVLTSTEEGLKALRQLRQDDKIGGLAMRTLRLTGEG